MRLITRLMVLLLAFFVIGCGEDRPDPRENPDFNEETLNDPGSVELGPLKPPAE